MNSPDPTANAPQKKSWSAHGYITSGLVAVLLLAGGLGTWSATAELAGAVIANGQLRVEAQRQVVQHPDGGVVGEIMVREGDLVEAGDVMIRLDGTTLTSELAVIEGELFEIMARRGRLTAERDSARNITFDPELVQRAAENPAVNALMQGQENLFRARIESMSREFQLLIEREGQINEQIIGTEAQITSLVRQSELINQELEGVRKLFARGLSDSQRLLSLEREATRLGGQRGELLARKAQLAGQISELRAERIRLESRRREEAIAQLRDFGFRELELKERRIALGERLSRLDVRAPRTGVVYEMTVFALKAVVRPAEPILFIVPTDESLVIDAQIDPLHIDEIFQGQVAVVRFSALNSRTTPELMAELIRVSPDAHTDEQTGATYYRAEALLAEGEAERLEGQALMAGMPVELYIQTQKRTPIAYLMKPLTDYFSRAWRES